MSNGRNNPKFDRSALTLSDTQLVLLSAAAQREDHCLAATPRLKGGALQKVADKLISAGLVKEIEAKSGAPVWRCDEEHAQSYALKLTTAGLKAIAVDEDAPREGDASGASPVVAPSAMQSSSRPAADTKPLGEDGATNADADESRGEGMPTAPRKGSKLADVIGLLLREKGATIDELIAATNWLPHTTCAALTGLRRRGYGIERLRADGVTRYAITATLSTADMASGDEFAGKSATYSATTDEAA